MTFWIGGGTGFGVALHGSIHRLDGLPGIGSLAALLPRIADGWQPDLDALPTLPIGAVTLQPPIPHPGKILSVAGNFREQGQEGEPLPDYPQVFTRFADSLTGHGTPIFKPAVSEKFDFEGELAIVIGLGGHKIAREDAMRHVAGYACFNDGSARDWQRHSSQFTPGKNFHRSGGFGPWMMSKAGLPDPLSSTLRTRVNGATRQEIALERMTFDIGWLIAYVSTFTPLAQGDVIATGTPTGFGATRRPPVFLVPGDTVEVEVTGLGTLSNIVVQDEDLRPELFRNK